MSAPRPVDVHPEPRYGPSAADIASRIATADPVAQAQAEARIRAQAVAKQQQQQQLEQAREQQAAASASAALPPKPTKDAGYATVKAVASADTLVLIGSSAVAGKIPEKQLALSGISAPRPGRKAGQDDEPFAYESREFLRNMVIGKRVKFAVTYVNEASGREYGTVELDGEDVACAVVAAGWASVKLPPRAKDGKVPADREHIVELETAAKDQKIGIWSEDKTNAKRIMHYVSSDARSFFKEVQDTTVFGVVEHVREGSSFRVEVARDNAKGERVHHVFTMHLAGAQSPRIPLPYKTRLANWERAKAQNPASAGPKPQDEQPEPFAVEALNFADKNVLHRDVTVRVQGCDKGNNLFGSIRLPQGDLATALLQNGLARYVGWSAAFSGQKDELSAAEAAAQAARRGIWRHFSQEKMDAISATHRTFTAKVVQVVSPDTLVVVEPSGGAETRVYLASVRCPRMPVRGRAGEPWALEAHEFLRKRLIGRKVKVAVDYVRPAPPDVRPGPGAGAGGDRVYATVLLGGTNVAALLLREGFATVVRHRMDDERSSCYEELVEAEARAAKAAKGVHSKKEPVVAHAVVDLTLRKHKADDESEKLAREVSVKARQYLPFLVKSKRIKGVVEHVFNANRLKIRIPSQNCLIAFVFAGIRAPSSRGSAVEEFAEEAATYVRDRTLQHDVEVEVEALDRGDNFIGTLWVDRKNFAVQLLDRGLARVVPYSAEKSAYAEELFTSEKVAKKGKVGMWHTWDEAKVLAEQEAARRARQQEAAAEAAAQIQAQTLHVTVSEAFDCTHFYVLETDAAKADAIHSAIAEAVSVPPPSSGSVSGKRGELCLAKFNDGNWYRCKVEKREDDDLYAVSFIDFGNQASVTMAELRALPANNATLKQPGLAKCCGLTGTKIPRDYHDESVDAFLGMVWEKRFTAVIDAVDPNSHKLLVTLTAEQSDADDEKSSEAPVSVNAQMLRIGLARIPSRPLRSLKKQIERLRPYEQQAKSAFSGLWEYGDVSSDEEEGDRR